MRWTLIPLTAFLFIPTLAQAQMGPGHRGPGPEPDLLARHLARYLELTPDQERSIWSLREEHRIAARNRHETIRDLHRRLEESMDAPDPEPGELGRMLLEIRDLRQEIRHQREAMEKEVVTLLDAEQKLKLEHFRELMRLRREASRHRRMGPPRG